MLYNRPDPFHSIFIENNKIKGLNASHDLLEMLKKSDYNFSNDQDKESIVRLQFQLQSLSRYHIARNVYKQSKFSGVIETGERYYTLANEIIKFILKGEKEKGVRFVPSTIKLMYKEKGSINLLMLPFLN